MLNTLRDIGRDADKISSIEEALVLNNMNWDVETRPSFYYKADGSLAEMKSSFAMVRTDTEAMLGRVGGDYVPMRNSQALKHVDGLIASGAATLDAVFELKEGKRVGASLSLNEKISIAGEDPIELYLVVTTSHDGTQSTKTEITPIRMWCTNQMALVSKMAKQSWTVRHLSTMEDRLKVVENELKNVTNYAEWLQRTGDILVKKMLDEIELAEMTMQALSFVREEDRKKKMTGEILDVFKYSQLIGDDYRGTAWGGLNAVTEYFDHHRKYRNPNARYNSITNGAGARARNTMLDLLVAA